MSRLLYFVVVLVLAGPGAAAADTLGQEQANQVYAATLEVVVKKLEQDSLTYEKSLPMHLLPYHIRTDDYWSMGTAFAIGPNTFISAAHVFSLREPSLYRDFYLRDREGNVYTPDKVIKYSAERDFIVFTLKDYSVENYFSTNREPKLNSRVFAVGNAHGEGIVIRDGRFTSTTPEEFDGAWLWLRFSAAASPGNSGGPLLDDQGRVIGIVLRKSENENLNFALPIGEVLDADENMAVVHVPHAYRLEHLDARVIGKMDYETQLPLTIAQLNAKLVAADQKNSERMLEQLLDENREHLFPAGEGAESVLGSNFDALFPHIVWRQQDGNWTPSQPSDRYNSDLGKNGFVHYGSLGNNLLFRIGLPDDVELADFVDDGKLMMEYVNRAVGYSRTVGSEEIGVTSLGEPVSETAFRDKYGRAWTLRRWNIEYDDSAVAVISLPTPGGSVNILRSSGVSSIYSHMMDLKVVADFVYLTYYGTLKEWKEYLALGSDVVPTALQDMTLDYTRGQALKVAAGDIRFDYDADLQDISDNSDLMVYTAFFKEGDDKVVWDVSGVLAGEDKNSLNYFKVVRNVRPGKEENDESRDLWKRMAAQAFPYDMTSYFRDKNTFIGTTYPQGADADVRARQGSLYSVFYAKEGRGEQDALKERLSRFMQRLSIVR